MDSGWQANRMIPVVLRPSTVQVNLLHELGHININDLDEPKSPLINTEILADYFSAKKLSPAQVLRFLKYARYCVRMDPFYNKTENAHYKATILNILNVRIRHIRNIAKHDTVAIYKYKTPKANAASSKGEADEGGQPSEESVQQ